MASRLAGWLAARGLRDDPVVLCNKSHSGSRLLARLLDRAGLFLGAHRNESEDAWDLLPVVRYLVIRHYPDYRATAADALLPDLLEAALARHLEGIAPGQPWGWKLSESGFILPVLAALLPGLRVVHLLRDGRDVAFSDHTGPTDAFWRKVFFDRDDIATWRGLALTGPAYRRRPHLFNARHWANAVAVTRRFGQDLGPRYRELRYEALCARPRESLAELLDWLGLPVAGDATDGIAIRPATGRFRQAPRRHLAAVLPIIAPLQAALGYPTDGT